jgi:hypothetical protein
MNKGKQKTQEQLQEHLKQIRHLIALGQTDSEIMDNLNIPRRTFYYYKKRINEECAEELQKKKVEDLAGDVDRLRDL